MAVITKIGEYPGSEMLVEEKQKRLYHYTTLESFLKIWTTKRLLFSDLSKMNDLLESHRTLSVPVLKEGTMELWSKYHDCVYKYKQISLTMDYDSYIRGCMSNMMWGHYGQKGNGVCIELNPSKLDLTNAIAAPVEYSNEAFAMPQLPYNLVSNESIDDYIYEHHKLIFFTKTKDWSGENEFRIISNISEYIDISNAITNIYVTSSNSITCKCVEKLVNDEVPVMFFHHLLSDGILVPTICSTKKYRDSRVPKQDKSSVIFENGRITLRKTDSNGKEISRTVFGKITLTPTDNNK